MSCRTLRSAWIETSIFSTHRVKLSVTPFGVCGLKLESRHGPIQQAESHPFGTFFGSHPQGCVD